MNPAANREVELLRSPLLSEIKSVAHGFSTRGNDRQAGAFGGLNLARLGNGEPLAQLRHNRAAVVAALPSTRSTRWKSAVQVHGDQVVQVTAAAGLSIKADGLWTTDPGAAVAVTIADCLPILIANRTGTAIAAIHAGWRGTAKKIAATAVQRLRAAGIAPQELGCALGPAIGPCCFKIQREVADELRTALPGQSGIAPQQEQDNAGSDTTSSLKWSADLWELNRTLLEGAGVPPESIDTIRRCTCCDQQLFSYRRDGDAAGRQCGIIALRGR